MKTKLCPRWYDVLFSILFSLCGIFAYSFDKTNSSSLVNGDKEAIINSLFTFLLLSFTTLLVIILSKIVLGFINKKLNNNISKEGIVYKTFSKHPFIISLIIILVLWLPYIIIRFPLVTEWDAYHQILGGLGLRKVIYNWPYAVTMFYGGMINFGKMIFGAYNSAGLFLVIVQSLICACCLAYSMTIINKFKLSKWIKLFALLIYGIATIYPRYTTAIVKDSLFSCLVILVLSILIDIIILKNYSYKNFVFLVIATFLMCISRSNGIFIIYFGLVYLIIYLLKSKNKFLLKPIIAFVIIVISYNGYNLILKNNGFKGSSIAEALSIPFQQTARYAVNYPDEVTEEEKLQINAVLDYDKIIENYNPRLSDDVKSTYHGTNEDLFNYFKGAWLKQFLKHPDVYFDATFNNIYGYFYPLAKEEESGIYDATNNDATIKLFDESVRNKEALESLNNYIEGFEDIHILNFFCNSGIQFWLVFYICLYLLSKKKFNLLFILLPSVIGILVCIAGPTFTWNGLRYALPVIYSSPMILSLLNYINRGEHI